MDLHLLPAGSTDTNQAIWSSTSSASNVEHIFAEIPQTGNYEFWVIFGGSGSSPQADYAVAWWAGGASSMAMLGDYNGDTIVDINDYNLWRASFGSMSALAADGNGNNVIDAADYAVWRDNLGATLGAGSVAAVPEPGGAGLMVVAVGVVGTLSRQRRGKGLAAL